MTLYLCSNNTVLALKKTVKDRLTYLCGHNKPIIVFRPALKLLSRCLCFARASSIFNLDFSTRTWSSHPPMTANHRIKHTCRGSLFIHPNHMAEPAKPLDINGLSNVHVIEELIQLPVGSDTAIIANS